MKIKTRTASVFNFRAVVNYFINKKIHTNFNFFNLIY